MFAKWHDVAVSFETSAILKQRVSHCQAESLHSVSVIEPGSVVEGFGARLRLAFDGAKNAEIARRLEVTDAAARNYLNNRIPGPDMLLKIWKETRCSLHWLLTGEGPEQMTSSNGRGSSKLEKFRSGLEEGEFVMYLGSEEHRIINGLAGKSKRTFEDEVREQLIEHLEEKNLLTTKAGESNVLFFGDYVPAMVSLPFRGEIAAGEPILIFEQEEMIDVPDFRRTPGKQYMVLRARGDSMIEEKIHDGSLIMCEVTNIAQKGDTVVAVIDGDKATVKRFFPERGRIRLQPANPTHLPQYITDDRLQIQGIVVGIFHKPA